MSDSDNIEASVAKPPFYDKVFHKSSEHMDDLPDCCVSLTVTSPPYWNAIDYDRHSEDPTQDYRTRQYAVGFEEYEEYLRWFEKICCEVLRVTKPGGFYAIVVGTVLLDKKHYPVPFDIAAALSRKGWDFHQDYVWHKVTGGVKRAGVLIQRPYPGYFYPNIMTEYILVFRKPGPPIFHRRNEAERENARIPTERLFTNEIANNVWHIAPVPPGHLDHPCAFPEEIPYRLIQLYSYPNDLVLDPFCGSGQTLKVAHHLSRHYVGYDINKKYVELSERRIHEPSGIREEQLVAVFDKIPIDTKRVSVSRNTSRTRYGKKKIMITGR